MAKRAPVLPRMILFPTDLIKLPGAVQNAVFRVHGLPLDEAGTVFPGQLLYDLQGHLRGNVLGARDGANGGAVEGVARQDRQVQSVFLGFFPAFVPKSVGDQPMHRFRAPAEIIVIQNVVVDQRPVVVILQAQGAGQGAALRFFAPQSARRQTAEGGAQPFAAPEEVGKGAFHQLRGLIGEGRVLFALLLQEKPRLPEIRFQSLFHRLDKKSMKSSTILR